MKKIFILTLLPIFFVQIVTAQKRRPSVRAETNNFADTGKPKTVTVTSAYKPVLKTAAKINFSAASPPPDSVLSALQYNVPSQSLFFSYQPAALQPLAIDIDTSVHWENKNYIKAGYGNYSTPYLQAGFSLGDGQQSVINVHAKHTSSKGSLPFQQYSKTNLDVIGIFNPNENVEWNGKLFFNSSNQYQYGFKPDTLKFSKDDLRQRFTTFGGKAELRNKKENT